MLSVGVFAEVCGKHNNKFFCSDDRIEEPMVADPITPGIRFVIHQFLDVLPEIGLLAQLRINVVQQFMPDSFPLSAQVFFYIAAETGSFKYPELIQSAFPSVSLRLCGTRTTYPADAYLF